MTDKLVKMHRVLALGLAAFILSHLTIHLTAIGGAEKHVAALSKFQPIYRNWLIEPILYIAILTQVYVGGNLVLRRFRQDKKGFWGWAQVLSGAYLAMFMIVHGFAALITRHFVGLETNFYWAAGTLNIHPLQYLFAPYYTLGIFSIFLHLASAIHFGWRKHGTRLAYLLIGIGLILSLLIVYTFSGGFYDIDLPNDVIDSFEKYLPF